MFHLGEGSENKRIKIYSRRSIWMAQKFQPYLCCLHEYDTNKILKDKIITMEDDPFAQRHENLGTEKMYAYL